MTRNEREDVGDARTPTSDSQTAREGMPLGHAPPSPDPFCLEREINMGGHDISGYEPTHDILRGQGEEANQCKWTIREDSPTTIDTMDSPPSSVHNAVVCKFPGPCPIPGTRKKRSRNFVYYSQNGCTRVCSCIRDHTQCCRGRDRTVFQYAHKKTLFSTPHRWPWPTGGHGSMAMVVWSKLIIGHTDGRN